MNCYRYLLLLVCLAASSAQAARPFVTDDARLTTAQSCQLESWMRTYPQSREFWALPACNFTGNLEFTVGAGRARYDDSETVNDYVFQAKTLFRELKTNDWGIGLAAGKVMHPAVNPGPNLLGNTYAYVPLTVSMLDDRVFIHTNIGWLHDRATQRNNMTWGVGGEYWMTSRVSVLAESFGDNRVKPYWQTGLRGFVVPDRVQIDATVGNQVSGTRDSRWFSIGLRLTPDSFF